MKRIFYLVMFLLVVNASLAFAETSTYYVVTAKEGAVMTTTAKSDGMKVAHLQQGTRVTVVAQEDTWTRIDYNGRLGWVQSAVIAPFTKDLLPAYALHYATLNEAEHVVYALLSDFTGDGVEDLYLVTDEDTSKGEYIEKIYSSGQVMYQKASTDALTILRDGAGYSIHHEALVTRDTMSTLKDLNNQAQTDYYEASAGRDTYKIQTNTYGTTVHILQAGSERVKETTWITEEITSKDYFGAALANTYDESIYAQHYFTVGEKGEKMAMTQADFQAEMAPYERAKMVIKIYDDAYRSAALARNVSFKKERVLQELFTLAEQAQQMQSGDLLVMSAEELALLRTKLAQSALLEMPFADGERTQQLYVEKVLHMLAGEQSVDVDARGFYSFDGQAVDAELLAFYGVEVDKAVLNEQVAGVLFEDGHYVAKLEETVPDSRYRQLTGIEKVGTAFYAVQFADYDMPRHLVVDQATESKLIAGTFKKAGSVIFKRLPEGWVYIDTVENMAGLNMLRLEEYADGLVDAKQEPVVQLAEKPIAEMEQVPSSLASEEPIQQTLSLWVIVATIIFSFGLGYVFFAYKYTWRTQK